MKKENMGVNGESYSVRIHLEERKTSRVSIGKTGIIIRIPSFLPREERFKEIIRLKAWARKKLEERPIKLKEQAKRYHDGDILRIGDEEYALKIDFKEKKNSSARIRGNSIYLIVSSALADDDQNKHMASLLSRCIASKRLPKLKEKIDELNAKHFNQNVNKIFFKHSRSRWGSCSETSNINISTRLLFAPDDVLTYVCIHELAHLIEQNHSDAFWALVRKAMPDHKEKEAWLKQNGDACRF